MKLLTPGADNPKTNKHRDDFQFESVILHLAPASISGDNMCPMASPGCAAACLNTAGRGATKKIQEPRIRKTRYFKKYQEGFVADLVGDLESTVKRATKNNRKPVARLNGTSDIAWERIPVTRNGTEYANVFAAFPEIMFYDYTKVLPRLKRCRDIPNYRLTFSLSESNDAHAVKALEMGYNVAAVIRNPGSTFAGLPVIVGDDHDYRFLDPQGGHIVALTAKGRAIKDTSGFVRDPHDTLDASRTPTFATMNA